MADEYGQIVIIKNPDGCTVEQADGVAGISSSLFSDEHRPYMFESGEVALNGDGHLIICGQVTYRPVRFADQGRVIVCEKVT